MAKPVAWLRSYILGGFPAFVNRAKSLFVSALRASIGAAIWFAKWYWNRVKEIPKVFGAFTLGGITTAGFMVAGEAVARSILP